jgi:hypothetical protein
MDYVQFARTYTHSHARLSNIVRQEENKSSVVYISVCQEKDTSNGEYDSRVEKHLLLCLL